MKQKSFKPYAILIIDEKKPLYGIMRFNTLEKDWYILDDIFDDINKAKDFINELNIESGNVTIPL